MIVREVMTANPYVAKATDSIETVMHKLAEADVRHLPIVDAGTLVGIVSDRDLRSLLPTPLDRVERASGAAQRDRRAIGEVMSSDLVFVDAEDELGDAVDLMIEHKIGALPVVNGGGLELVGILSYVDVLRAARDLL